MSLVTKSTSTARESGGSSNAVATNDNSLMIARRYDAFFSRDYEPTITNALEHFIRTYAHLARNYDRECQLVHFWLNSVAPSCVYPIRISDEPLFFQCCICSAPIRRSNHLIRHYREQHFDLLPENIFGKKDYFPCNVCCIAFTRQDNLALHLSSVIHLERLASRGSMAAQERIDAIYEARQDFKRSKDAKQRRAFLAEQRSWERNNKRVRVETSSSDESDDDHDDRKRLCLSRRRNYDDEESESEHESIPSTQVPAANDVNDGLLFRFSRSTSLVENLCNVASQEPLPKSKSFFS